MAAFGAVAAVNLVQSTASPLDVWRLWFASCLLGTVTVAPLLIGLGEAVRELPPRRELIEGAAGLVTLAVLSVFRHFTATGAMGDGLTRGPGVPPAAMGRRALSAGVCSRGGVCRGVGRHLVDNLRCRPLRRRKHTSCGPHPRRQTLVLAGALLLLILAALFAERRRSEAALRDSNDRLQLALDGSELGVWSIDPRSGRFENDARDRRIHGHHPQAPPKSLAEARPFVHPDDLPNLDAAFAASGRTGGSYKAEYRLASVPGHADVGQERWIAVRGTVVRNAAGRPVRLLGVTHDITERKQAEAETAEERAGIARAAWARSPPRST